MYIGNDNAAHLECDVLGGGPVPESPAWTLARVPAHWTALRVSPGHAARTEHGGGAGPAPRVSLERRVSDLSHDIHLLLNLCPVILVTIDLNVLIGSQSVRQSGLLRDEGVVCEPHALGDHQLPGGAPGRRRQS